MSRHPPIRPEQGSYVQFQLDRGQSNNDTPYRRDKQVLTRLRDSIPQNESQWQQARQLHKYFTSEDVLQKTKDILEDRTTKQDLRNFISIADCCVLWHLGRKQDAYRTFRSRVSPATELTVQKYMSSVRAMVQAMDLIYVRGLRHRVFEATFLYAKIGPSFLTYYTKDNNEFSSCFPAVATVESEIHASLALSPIFILKYRHPEHSYKVICKALGTSILDEEAYVGFVSVLESGRLVRSVMPPPENNPQVVVSVGQREQNYFDPGLQVAAVIPDDMQSDDIVALPANLTLLSPIFTTSNALQILVKKLEELPFDQHPREIPNTPLFELQWATHHDVILDQLLDDLIQEGILPQQPFHRYKSFYRQEPGSIHVSPGWIQIIVPALVGSSGQISIACRAFEKQNITWDTRTGLILSNDMRLSTSQTIFYSLVSIPIENNT